MFVFQQIIRFGGNQEQKGCAEMANRLMVFIIASLLTIGFLFMFDVGKTRTVVINHTKPILYSVKNLLLGKP